MASITTRAGKGSALTHGELDANFTNLNQELAGKADETLLQLQSELGVGGSAIAKGLFNLNSAPLGSFYSVNGAESDAVANNWPSLGVNSAELVWFNVLTFGVSSRTLQIASQAFNGIKQGRTFIRQRHDTTWSAWKEIAYTDSPALTGNPTAPTPAITDRDTSISTTEFAHNLINSFGIGAAAPLKTAAEMNAFDLPSGQYRVAAIDSPLGLNSILFSTSYSATASVQMIFAVVSDPNYRRMLWRTSDGAVWTEWIELVDTDSPAFTGNASVSGRTLLGAVTDNGVDRLQVNGSVSISGRLIQEGQPVFMGTLPASSTSLSDYYPAISTVINRGGFSVSGGRITLPVAGRYYISAKQLIGTAAVTAYLEIRHNGVVKQHGYSNSDDTFDIDAFCVIDAAANDYIELYYRNTTTNTWSGPHSSVVCFLMG